MAKYLYSHSDGVYSRDPADLPPRADVGGALPDAGNYAEPPVAELLSGGAYAGSTGVGSEGGIDSPEALLQRASAIWSQSTDYLMTNIENDWETNLSHFQGEHAPGSKYLKSNMRRSKVFRPKTRAAVKQQEAGLATAMFSSVNLIQVNAQNPTDERQVISARINKELLQYRLKQRMPWTLTVLGAYQDTKVYGICISHQYWEMKEDKSYTAVTGEDGNPLIDDEGFMLADEHTTVRENNLRCDLIPPENFRFDPLADWRDPANTSSYLIIVRDMRVIDVENMMRKNGGPWLDYDREQLRGGARNVGDRVRYAREGQDRTDPVDSIPIDGLTTVRVHMNIIRENGEDLVYWTLATHLLLSEPQNLHEAEPWLRPGERPVTVGFSTVEAHKNYPAGDVQQARGLQEEINDVANTRLDNVRLSLNKRYFAKRGSDIDIGALVRNTPGSVVMMNDPERDIQEINTPDVTQSSYKEQEVLNTEVDQLVGGFDAQRIAQDGASPGGIARAGAVASAVQDYGVMIFVESWVEPVLSQLLRLEQMFEDDEVILAIAAERADVLPEELDDDLLEQDLVLSVDASIGTLDPLRKVDRLRIGIEGVLNLPGMAERLKSQEVAAEMFSSLGWAGTDKFFLTDEEVQKKLEQNPPGPSEMDVKMKELEIREADNNMRNERERMRLEMDGTQKELDIVEREQRANSDRMSRLEQQIMQLQNKDALSARDNQTKRDIEAARLAAQTREQNLRLREMREKNRNADKSG